MVNAYDAVRKYWSTGDGPRKFENFTVNENASEDLDLEPSPPSIDEDVEGNSAYPADESEGPAFTELGFTGSSVPTTLSASSASISAIPYPSSAATHSVSAATGSIYAPSTTSGRTYATGGVIGGPGSWASAKSSKKRFVRMPPRFTDKVLVGFIDPEEKDPSKDVTWAANLPLIDAEMSMREGKMELVLTLSLEDIYGNNPKDEEED